MNKVLSVFFIALMASNVCSAGSGSVGIYWASKEDAAERRAANTLFAKDAGGLVGGTSGAAVGAYLGTLAVEAMFKSAQFKALERSNSDLALSLGDCVTLFSVIVPLLSFGYYGVFTGMSAGEVLAYRVSTESIEAARDLLKKTERALNRIASFPGVVFESAKRTGEILLSGLQSVAKLPFDYPEVSVPLVFAMLVLIDTYFSASSAFEEALETSIRLSSAPDITVDQALRIFRNQLPEDVVRHIMSHLPSAKVPLPNFYDIFFKLLPESLQIIGAWTLAWQVPSLRTGVTSIVTQVCSFGTLGSNKKAIAANT